MQGSVHKPVLLKEVLKILKPEDGIYVDCTLGGGGYTLAIANSKLLTEVVIYAFDIDKEAIQRFKTLLNKEDWNEEGKYFKKGKKRIKILSKNFALLKESINRKHFGKVNGIVADLGLSSDQLEEENRGFSFQKDGPLDMRMDETLDVTAADLVNGLYEKELIELFRSSDERYAKPIARMIVREREKEPIKTTLHLTNIIQKALPKRARYKLTKGAYSNQTFWLKDAFWMKPAMRVFQSLRIAVNSELSSLQKMLPQAFEALAAGGLFIVVSFHSGEDRIVKQFFRGLGDRVEILTKKPIEASEKELKTNLRARSAKLRAYKKK